VEVVLIPGISHGFVQFVSVFPQGWKHIFRCGRWIEDIFAKPPHAFEGPNMALKNRLGLVTSNSDSGSSLDMAASTLSHSRGDGRHHHRTMTGESSADEDAPLAMSSLTREDTPPTSNGHTRGGRGRGGRRRGHDTRSDSPEMDRSKSVASLGSEEDLLKRRMKGLTISLMGTDE
jgi:hypothetical protein